MYIGIQHNGKSRSKFKTKANIRTKFINEHPAQENKTSDNNAGRVLE